MGELGEAREVREPGTLTILELTLNHYEGLIQVR